MHNAPEQDFHNPDRWDPSRLDRERRLALMAGMDRIAVLLPEYRDWYRPELRSRVHVLPNAVAPVPAGRREDAARERVVIAVGRLARVKRHDLLVEAWARVAPAFPGWELRLYGSGPLRGELAARIAATGLPSLRLMGHTDAIKEAYLSAALLAHPAEFEGFPLAVTEALASGLPVVGFADCSGLNALVSDDVNGVLVSAAGDRVEAFASALAALMGDEARRRRLGAAGPASVAPYDPDSVTALWEELLFGPAPPGAPGEGA